MQDIESFQFELVRIGNEIGIFVITAADSSSHDIYTDANAEGSHLVYEPPNAVLDSLIIYGPASRDPLVES
jgi:hypothetical protein